MSLGQQSEVMSLGSSLGGAEMATPARTANGSKTGEEDGERGEEGESPDKVLRMEQQRGAALRFTLNPTP